MSVLLDLFLTFAKIGLFTFGGGYAMISMIENACVRRNSGLLTRYDDVTVIADPRRAYRHQLRNFVATGRRAYRRSYRYACMVLPPFLSPI